MNVSSQGLPLAEFAAVCQIDRDHFRSMKHRDQLPLPSLVSGRSGSAKHRYQYDDALTVEAAKMLHEDGGCALSDALRVVAASDTAAEFFNYQARKAAAADFWIGVIRYRVRYESAPLQVIAGINEPKPTIYETWCRIPVFGPLAEVTEVTTAQIGAGATRARVELANVSLADRLLRQRAATMGFNIANDRFVGTY